MIFKRRHSFKAAGSKSASKLSDFLEKLEEHTKDWFRYFLDKKESFLIKWFDLLADKHCNDIESRIAPI